MSDKILLTGISGWIAKHIAIDLLKSDGGIPTTVSYDGAIRYEMAFNDETYSVHLVGEWENYDKYAQYLNWRMTEDDFISKMIPLMVGGENGLKVLQSKKERNYFGCCRSTDRKTNQY